MAREKMHKEMVPSDGFFLRRAAERPAGMQELSTETPRNQLEKSPCHYVKTDKNNREKLAVKSFKNPENILANS